MAQEFNLPGLKEVISDVKKLQEETSQVAKAMLQLSIANEKAFKPPKDGLPKLKPLAEETELLRKQTEQLAQAEQKMIALRSESAKELAKANVLIQQQNKDLKQEAMERLGLVSAYTKLNKERLEAKKVLLDLLSAETQNAKAIKEAQKEFDALDARVRSADKAVGDFHKNVGNYPQVEKLAVGVKDLFEAFGLAGATIGAGALLSNAMSTIKEFDQGLADLSAITGATGEDLDFLKSKAIDLGRGTQGGAVAVIEAYKLIASAKPELLSNVDALNQVTEATITLSKASGMDMATSATALTDAMNQFNAPAEQAGVFIDALANGAKFGSAEIPQVTEALLKFGAVAKTSNISIQESTALIELLAEKGVKGAEAGTALRNVLLKISAPDALPRRAQEELIGLGISMEKLKDNTIPIADKFELLQPLLKNNASLVKVFGLENEVAGQILIENKTRLDELTKSMYEVGTAEEQANIRTNTLKGSTEKLVSTWDSLVLNINEGSGALSGFFKFWTDGAKSLLDDLMRINSSWSQLNKQAEEKGKSDGVKSFQRQFQGRKVDGLIAPEETAKAIEEDARKLFEKYEKEYNTMQQKAIDLANKSGLTGSSRESFISRGIDPKRKEELSKLLAEQRSVVAEAKKMQNDILKPKAGVAPNDTSISSDGEGDAKAKRAKEAKLKKEQDDQRKSLQYLIDSKKIALDYIVASYKQEDHTADENLAHVKAVSAEKSEIAKLQLQKDLIGIEKGSGDAKNIIKKNSGEVEKIRLEEANAIEKIRVDGVNFELELYDLKNKSLIDEGAKITDLLIEQEKKRIDEEYKMHKDGLSKIYELDEEKVKQKVKDNQKLTEAELKYLKDLDKLEDKKKAEDKKSDKLLADTKKKEAADDKKRADDKKELDKQIADGKKEIAEDGLEFIQTIAGKESEIGKAAAIAQIAFSTYEKASELFGIGATQTAKAAAAAFDPLTAALAPGYATAATIAYVQAGVTIANGTAQSAKVAGFFAEGTDYAPYTGKAVVDEEGPEIHMDKNGNIKSLGSKGGARLTDIVQGDKIIPHSISEIIKQMMFAPYRNNSSNIQDSIDYEKIGSQFGKHASKIVQAVNNNGKNQLSVHISPNNQDRVIFRGKRV